MSEKSDVLNDLIPIARDGRTFYEHAAKQVKDPVLKRIFHHMVEAKTQLIRELSIDVSAQQQKPSSSGTIAGGIREVYADLKARLSTDAGAAYVSELEDTEDRLLHAFREAQADTTSPDVQRAIAAYLPQVQACHDEMKLLKDAARADSAALRKDVDSQHSLADRDQKDRLQNEGGATQPGQPPQEKSPAELIGHAHGQPTSPGDTKPKS